LTIKPVGFRIKVRPRRDRAPLVARTTAPPQAVVHPEHETAATPEMRSGTPLLVLYGSNTGASETIAHRIGEDATVRGYRAQVEELDAMIGKLPKTARSWW